MKQIRPAFLLFVLLLSGISLAQATEAALVTTIEGKAVVASSSGASSEIQPFIKLLDGERVTLTGDARLQIVYFENGTQETWQGTGVLDIGHGGGKTSGTTLTVQRKTLPAVLVKQLAKTPSPDGNVRAGMVRMRSMSSVAQLTSAEQTYADARAKSPPEDLTPDLYLLATYFELQAFDRLENRLSQLRSTYPKNAEVEALAGLYARAIRFARTSGQPQ